MALHFSTLVACDTLSYLVIALLCSYKTLKGNMFISVTIASYWYIAMYVQYANKINKVEAIN